MGFTAAMRTRRSVEELRRVLAVEMVCAAQALELRAPLRPAPATGALLGSLRTRVDALQEDRYLGSDLYAAEDWLRSDAWRSAVESVLSEALV
jgi:histidine ammonia-lyase